MHCLEWPRLSMDAPEDLTWEIEILHKDFFEEFFSKLNVWDRTSFSLVNRATYQFCIRVEQKKLFSLKVGIDVLLHFSAVHMLQDLSASLMQIQKPLLQPVETIPKIVHQSLTASMNAIRLLVALKAVTKKPLKDRLATCAHNPFLERVVAAIYPSCIQYQRVTALFGFIIATNQHNEDLAQLRPFYAKLLLNATAFEIEDMICYEAIDHLMDLGSATIAKTCEISEFLAFLQDPFNDSLQHLMLRNLWLAARKVINPLHLQAICQSNFDLYEVEKDDIIKDWSLRLRLEAEFGLNLSKFLIDCLQVIGEIAKNEGLFYALYESQVMCRIVLESEEVESVPCDIALKRERFAFTLKSPFEIIGELIAATDEEKEIKSVSRDSVLKWARFAIALKSPFETAVALIDAIDDEELVMKICDDMLSRAALPGYDIEASQLLSQMQTKAYFLPALESMCSRRHDGESYMLDGQQHIVNYRFQSCMLKACREGAPTIVVELIQRLGHDDVYIAIARELAIALAKNGGIDAARMICQKSADPEGISKEIDRFI